MDKVKIDMLYLLMASFGVIGLIEWVKSLVAAVKTLASSKWKDWKELSWVLLSFLLSGAVAAAGDGGLFQVLSNWVFVLAINEVIGYNVIVKAVFSLIDRLTGGGPSVAEALAGLQTKVGALAQDSAKASKAEPKESP